MKRIISAILTAAFTLSLVACGGSSAAAPAAGSANSASGANRTVEVDKNLLSVEVTLPASMMESKEDFDDVETPEDYCARMEAEDGIQSATVNADGSVTLKMTKAKHQEMLDAMKTSLDEEIADFTNGETYASIKEITYNSDLTKFEMSVDREAYENSFDGFALLGLGVSGMYYGLLNGENDPHITIAVADAATGEKVGTSVFPDDFEGLFDDSEAADEAESGVAAH